MSDTRVIVFPDDVSVFEIVQRSYDFNLGDRRFVNHQDAIDFATSRASETGVRQQVRLDSPHGLETFYLVQAIGS